MSSFNFILKQSGTSGYLIWAYKEDSIKTAANALSFVSDSDFNNLRISGINKIEVLKEMDVIITGENLTKNTSYMIYYYGENNGLPRMKTPIYTQVVTTKASADDIIAVGSLRYGLFSILINIIMIMIIIFMF